MPERPPDRTKESRRGEHNEIGYRIVDEEQTYDERGGSQTPGPGEPPADEEQGKEQP
jgi:hypothetical protein